jgi:DDE superfamily endonuclease
MMVARGVWRKLKPHRIERYMASNDPDFEKKAADVIGLYLNPPAHAAIFCVDEKTAVQALDRKDPVLPLSPGRAERHGTLSLYAAFNTKTGEVPGRTAARHTSAEFVAFLTDILVNQPHGKEIHVIADNLSTHKTGQVRTFLAAHPNVHLHFTPTYSCPGSTRSSCGSARSNAMSSHAGSSPRSLTSRESSCATSASAIRRRAP